MKKRVTKFKMENSLPFRLEEIEMIIMPVKNVTLILYNKID